MLWDVNKHTPVPFPVGYTLIAVDQVKEEPAPATDSHVESAPKQSAKHNAAGIDRRSERTVRQQNSVAVNEAIHQLLVRTGHEADGFTLKKHDTGKPYGLLDGRQVGVGISHCRSLLICSLYTDGETGVDVEPCDRTLHPSLYRRICHPDEYDKVPDELCGIRLWTVKEAVLKYLGTGLRMAMNKIKLEMVDEFRFRVEIGPDIITIASFTFHKHWIAVAFREPQQEQHTHPRLDHDGTTP